MISTEKIFQDLLALTRNDQAGYHSTEDFNSQQSLVQEMLFSYHLEKYEASMESSDALVPFMREKLVSTTDGYSPYPASMRHIIALTYAPGGKLYRNANYVKANEEGESVFSSVRKPSILKNRFYWAKRQVGFMFYPVQANVVSIKYFVSPPSAFRGATINVVDAVENPDPSTTVDFAWPAKEENNILDGFLILKGLQSRQTDFINWAMARKQK